MDRANAHLAEREAQRMQANREELVERIALTVREDGTVQPLEGLYLSRSSTPLENLYSVFEPCLCVIAQGSKEILLNDDRYRYDPDHYLIVTVDLPHIARVVEASREHPYLSLRMNLPPALVGAVMMDAGKPLPPTHVDARAMDVNPLDVNLQDAVVRLIRLIDAPATAPALLPLIMREIIYLLSTGKQSARLYHVALMSGYTSPVVKVIEHLRHEFDQPLRIEDLAREVGMSISGLEHHFKAVTAMSPLQFMKRLRLQEARRLMLSEHLDAASTAYRLGYHDPAHFNREYKSLFGVSPMRDVQRIREAIVQSAD